MAWVRVCLVAMQMGMCQAGQPAETIDRTGRVWETRSDSKASLGGRRSSPGFRATHRSPPVSAVGGWRHSCLPLPWAARRSMLLHLQPSESLSLTRERPGKQPGEAGQRRRRLPSPQRPRRGPAQSAAARPPAIVEGRSDEGVWSGERAGTRIGRGCT